MPYDYYQFVRFVALVGFGYLGYKAILKNNNQGVFVYLTLALLFQPFFKIALGRELWNIVDAIVAIVLLVSLFVSRKDKVSN